MTSNIETSIFSLKISNEKIDNLKNLIAKERWYWEKKIANDLIEYNINKDDVKYSSNIKLERASLLALFPDEMTLDQCDVIISLWDFLDMSRKYIGDVSFSLYELILSLFPPIEYSISIGQVIFDEICCLLTSMLLQESRKLINANEEGIWQKFLISKPLNITTWPIISLSLLHLYIIENEYQLPSNIAKILLEIPKQDLSLQLSNIVSILFRHPSLTTVINQTCYTPVTIAEHPIVKIRNNVLLGTHDYKSVDELRNDIIKELTLTMNSQTANSNCFKACQEIMDYMNKITINNHFNINELINENGLGIGEFNSFCNISSDGVENIKGNFPDCLDPFDFAYKSFKSCNGNDELLIANKKMRIKILLSYTKTLHLLSNTEPEVWTLNNRVDILATLLKVCSCTYAFKDIISSTKIVNSNIYKKITIDNPGALNNIADVPSTPINNCTQLDNVAIVKSDVCYFTGLSGNDEIINNYEWVNVPEILLVSQSFSTDDATGNNNTSDRKIALKQVVQLLLAAREISLIEFTKNKSNMEAFESYLLDDFDIGEGYFTNLPTNYSRTKSIGRDSDGNEYWLLSVQENAPYLTVSSFLGERSKNNLLEPYLLVRSYDEKWKYINCTNLRPLLEKLSSSKKSIDMVFRYDLLERMAYTKRRLHTGLFSFKDLQVEWLNRYCTKYIDYFKIPTDISVENKTKLLEELWTRCVENRSFIHHALIFKGEAEPSERSDRSEQESRSRRMKKLKEILHDEAQDHHPTKGFLRVDEPARIRELYATCTATKIHADPSMYSNYIYNMERSLIRKLLDGHETDVSTLTPTPTLLGTPYGYDFKSLTIRDPVKNHQLSVAANKQKHHSTIPLFGTPSQMNSNPLFYQSIKDLIHATQSDIVTTSFDNTIIETNTTIDETSETVEDDRDVNVDDDGDDDDDDGEINEDENNNNCNNSSVPSETWHPEYGPEGTTIGKTKSIEQIHPHTGEVLRIYASGKDAAAFLNVSQSGISLCCGKIKDEAYGFKWRFYSGPGIDLSTIRDKQASLATIQQLQIMRGKKMTPGPGSCNSESTKIVKQYVPKFKVGYFQNPMLNQINSDNVADPKVHQLSNDSMEIDNIVQLKSETETEVHDEIEVDDLNNVGMNDTYMDSSSILKTEEQIVKKDSGKNSFIQNNNVPKKVIKFYCFNESPLLPSSYPYFQQPDFTVLAISSLPKHMITSQVTISARLAKLKSEFLNIVSILPERKFAFQGFEDKVEEYLTATDPFVQFNQLQEQLISDEEELASLTSNDLAEVLESKDVMEVIYDDVNSLKIKIADTTNKLRILSKSQQKYKRKMRRKVGLEHLYSLVHNADSPQKLLEAILFIENSIVWVLPLTMKDYDKESIQSSTTCAAVALKIFSLDRCLRYDSPDFTDSKSNPVLNGLLKSTRPRTVYAPRCMINPQCIHFQSHGGNCKLVGIASSVKSRIPVGLDDNMPLTTCPILPAQANMSSTNHPSFLPSSFNLPIERTSRNQYSRPKKKVKLDEAPIDVPIVIVNSFQGFFKGRNGHLFKEERDIEYVNPYQPQKSEIESISWV